MDSVTVLLVGVFVAGTILGLGAWFWARRQVSRRFP